METIVLKDWKKLKEHCLKTLKEIKTIIFKKIERNWKNYFKIVKEIERILLIDGNKLKLSLATILQLLADSYHTDFVSWHADYF